MGALSKLMLEAEYAINELGKNDAENDGWKFKVDSSTWSMDDYVIRGGGGEDFVLAVAWANPPYGYKPCMPNMGRVFEKVGWKLIDKSEYDHLKEIEEKYNKLVNSGIDVKMQDTFVNGVPTRDFKVLGSESFRVVSKNSPITEIQSENKNEQ